MNGQPNSVSDQSKPMKTAMLPEPAAAGGGLSWANCCARPPDNDDGVFTEVSYKKAVKATAQQKVIPVVRGTKKRQRRLTAFVGRLYIDITEGDLSKFLDDAGLEEIRCKRLKPKDGQEFATAAFFVSYLFI